MLESLSSKTILTKIKAMHGHMLTRENYEQLMHKNSVSACAAYLKTQPAYAPVLRDVQETQIHRGALEALLGKALFEQYLRLEHYCGKSVAFLRGYYVAYTEIRCIVNCIRLLQSDNPNEFIQSIPGYIVGHLSFDVLSLGKVRAFGELLEALERTPYHRVLAPLAGRGEKTPAQEAELALYAYYYDYTNRLIDENFRGKTAVELHSLFSTQAQLFNIQAIYRLKHFFGVPAQEIEKVLLPYTARLPRRVMAEIVRAPDTDAMFEILTRSKYGAYFGKDRFVFIENSTGVIRFDLAKKYLTFSQNSVTAAVSFFILREIETENLITIIEGIRYRLDVAQVRPLLIQGGD